MTDEWMLGPGGCIQGVDPWLVVMDCKDKGHPVALETSAGRMVGVIVNAASDRAWLALRREWIGGGAVTAVQWAHVVGVSPVVPPRRDRSDTVEDMINATARDVARKQGYQ